MIPLLLENNVPGNHDINIHYVSTTSQSSMLMLSPESVNSAANILHEAFITSDELLDFQPKQVSLG